MLASIHPLGERARGNRFGTTVASHVAGSAVGGALVGAAAGALGTAAAAATSPTIVVAVAAVLAAVRYAVELRGGSDRIPQWHRQVDKRWLDEYRGWIYGFGYGVQLGAGVLTIVRTTTVHVMLLVAAATGSVAGGAAVGATFGLVRGASIFTAGGIDSPTRLVAFHRSFQRRERTARVLASTSLAIVPVALGVLRGDRVISGHGLSIDVPAGWDARIAGPPTARTRGFGVTADDDPEGRRALLHAASFPLPPERGAFGGGAVEQMTAGDLLLCLVEYDASAADTPLFAMRGLPRTFAPEDFDPNTMQRAIAGQSGVQRFFTEAGRAFCLYAVLGSHRSRQALVPRLNGVIATIAVDSMCDCLVALPDATAGGHTLFAKNSDRPPDEPQQVEWFPPRREDDDRYDVPDDPRRPRARRSGSSARGPTWMWGVEHGVNEAGVAAGNATIYTTLDPRAVDAGLTGMDLVRLALERSATASDAVGTIVELLERHGQGGSGHRDADRPYWSSFLIADPASSVRGRDVGPRARGREGRRGRAPISNRTTIPAFDAVHRHPRQPVERLVDPRLAASNAVLARRAGDRRGLQAHLRSHDGRDGWTRVHARRRSTRGDDGRHGRRAGESGDAARGARPHGLAVTSLFVPISWAGRRNAAAVEPVRGDSAGDRRADLSDARAEGRDDRVEAGEDARTPRVRRCKNRLSGSPAVIEHGEHH